MKIYLSVGLVMFFVIWSSPGMSSEGETITPIEGVQGQFISECSGWIEKCHKNVAVAALLGLFPGWGLGHFYAAEIKQGVGVSMWKLGGFTVIVLGGVLGFRCGFLYCFGRPPSESCNRCNTNSIYIIDSGIAIIGIGMLYDSIHSAYVVAKTNKELSQKTSLIHPWFNLASGNYVAGVTFSFPENFP